MKTPEIINQLIRAQNEQDAAKYARCFSETAIVHDEGKDHAGRVAIEKWIAAANEKYHTVLKPLFFLNER